MPFNYTTVAAAWITVYRMVDAAVTDSRILHTANDGFKCFQIICRISVHFHIGDMSSVCEFMIRSFLLNLLKCCYVIVYRYMEGICIVITICNTRYDTVDFLINPCKSSRQTFCRSCNKREVQTVFLCSFITDFTHMPYDFQTKLLRFFTFSVMFSDQRL